MSPNILMLSIQYKYAKMIFKGDKQVELRRVKPRHLNSGDLILVYVTCPEQALFGFLEVEKVVQMSPDKLWEIVKYKAGVTHNEFKKYYHGSSRGFAIFLKKTFSFDVPIELEDIKKEWLDFRPPQCYRYLRSGELKLIESLTNSDIFRFSQQPKYYQPELYSSSQFSEG